MKLSTLFTTAVWADAPTPTPGAPWGDSEKAAAKSDGQDPRFFFWFGNNPASVSNAGVCNPNFMDQHGQTCWTFSANGWCNNSGGHGWGWNWAWGTLSDYRNHLGQNPTSCPECGCKEPTTQPRTTTTSTTTSTTTTTTTTTTTKPPTQAPTQAPGPSGHPGTANDIMTPTPPSNPNQPDCSVKAKFCYWNDIGCGFSKNFIHQCAVSSKEKCWQMCQNYAGCKVASYDSKGRWATNCFLYSDITSGMMIDYPGMTSGWFCTVTPPQFPDKPSAGCWLPPSFPTPPTNPGPEFPTPTPTPTTATTTPKPSAPTCSGWGTMYCRMYGDPHIMSFTGRKWDQHDVGTYVMAEYTGNNLPKFRVTATLTRRWPCNWRISMVESFKITWQAKDGCGTWELEGRLGNSASCGPPHGQHGRRVRNWVTSSISYISNETGRRSGTIASAQWNAEGNNFLRHRQQMTLTTWFGLNIFFDSLEWDLQLKVPNCFRGQLGQKSLCIIAWGNIGWQHRARRAVIGIDDDAENKSLITDVSHAPVRRSANTCPLRSQIEARCGILSKSDGPFQQCHDKLPADGEAGFEENCIFDHCEDIIDGEPDACGVMQSYAKMCMTNMVGELKKTDRICKWAEETGCAQECPANAHWTACADQCRDVQTCGDRSPVPKDCGDAEFVSMCICDDGFYLMDGACVPESECGCVTDDQAVVADGFTEDTCEEKCKCENGVYSCEAHPEGTVIEGCEEPEEGYTPVDPFQEESADPAANLVAMTDDFKEKIIASFGDVKFARLVYTPMIKIRNRMKFAYKRFACPYEEPAGARTVSPCPELVTIVDNVLAWNEKHIADCNDPKAITSKRAKGYKKKLEAIKTRLEKRCAKKFSLVGN